MLIEKMKLKNAIFCECLTTNKEIYLESEVFHILSRSLTQSPSEKSVGSIANNTSRASAAANNEPQTAMTGREEASEPAYFSKLDCAER